ncbi:MAG: hypothetical protein NVV59_17640 [Chitinophagaceae bacterium]|nr:hypothetical protein [Chitinophagaceae bacterium]
MKSNIQNQKDTIDQIDSAIESSVASLDIEFDEELRALYEGLTGSFNQLCESWKIWDVTSSHFQDRVRTRSAASTLISKKVVRFSHKPIDDIRANITPIYFNNANGADLYFYPNFLIVYSSKRKFAILGLDEIRVEFSPVRFVETDLVPRDSKVIDRTWVKVNKNGTPDRRFKDNREIPIVQYGSIALKSPNGLNEEYMFSNFESAEDFCRRFLEYQKVLAQLNK